MLSASEDHPANLSPTFTSFLSHTYNTKCLFHIVTWVTDRQLYHVKITCQKWTLDSYPLFPPRFPIPLIYITMHHYFSLKNWSHLCLPPFPNPLPTIHQQVLFISPPNWTLNLTISHHLHCNHPSQVTITSQHYSRTLSFPLVSLPSIST